MKYVYVIIIILLLYVIFKRKRKDCDFNNKINKLVKQTSRWAVAAKQDNNSLIAVLHANYAMGYWYALNDIFDDNEIDTAIGGSKKRKMFEKRILKIQEDTTRKATKDCPQFLGEIDFISDLAGDS